eukprot:TRINITY_DN8262_c0_g1_i1.p1 TRINITY_DN8262_c0_g1~~TRINITY_DN8262_c0_g1_i1.p1  ORF type:complete len:264 (-),score=50.58 TRINITY_DN8262_c0_g1_i1:38-829(-)
MSEIRQTPWLDWEEWLSCYKLLFKNSEDAFEAEESRRKRRRKGLDKENQRLEMSMTITRFVNGLVDQYQTHEFAQSIAEIAHSIDLPPYLVEIRQQSTHQSIPPVSLLQKSCKEALKWLEENYWTKQNLKIQIQPTKTKKSSKKKKRDRPLQPLQSFELGLKNKAQKTSSSPSIRDIASLTPVEQKYCEESNSSQTTGWSLCSHYQECPIGEPCDSHFDFSLRGFSKDWKGAISIKHKLDFHSQDKVVQKPSERRKVQLLVQI